MKKSIFTLFLMLTWAWGHAQTDFQDSNLVVLRVGNGSTALATSGNRVFLDEYTPSGTLVQSVEIPASGDNKLILGGTDPYCGYLNRSADEKYLTLAGFNATVGQVADLDASEPSNISRSVAIVDAQANIDLSTQMTDDTLTPRGVVSTDGTDLWLSSPTGEKKIEGKGGILYASKGNIARMADINRRDYDWSNVKIFNNSGYNLLFAARSTASSSTTKQIYVFLSDNDHSNTTYTEIPTTFNTGTSYGYTESMIKGVPNYLTDFVLLDQSTTVNGLDVAYIASSESSAGSLTKVIGDGDLSFSNTTYTLSENTYNYYGITADSVSENIVVLYATRLNTTSSNYELVKITDISGQDGDPADKVTIEVLATAPSGTAFRGVALAPQGGRSTQSISNFGNIEKTYGDADFALEAKASSGLDVTYTIADETVATITNDSVHILKTDTTTITATQAGNDAYKPVEATISLMIDKATQTPVDYSKIGNITKTVGDADFDLEVTLTSGREVYYVMADESIATVSGATVSIVGAGTTTIYALEDGNTNYKPFSASFTLTVNEAASSINELTDDNNSLMLSPNPVGGDVVNITLPKAAGNHAVLGILSVSGEWVSSQVIAQGHSTVSLNVSNLEQGIYFISYTDSHIKTTQKIVKK